MRLGKSSVSLPIFFTCVFSLSWMTTPLKIPPNSVTTLYRFHCITTLKYYRLMIDLAATIRLVNGVSDSEGRVEVLHEGIWGTICDDGWDNVDATVVCQSLGYRSGIALIHNEFGDGSDPIWLDEVECTGSESRLEDCPKNDWGEEDCFHFEDAGVRCS